LIGLIIAKVERLVRKRRSFLRPVPPAAVKK
jgi:hypothetical protein